MNAFADALNRAGIEASDFEDVEVDEKAVACNLEIEFLENWLKLVERGASPKEKYLFATKHGFASEKHLNLYLSLTGEINDLDAEIHECPELFSPKELKAKKKDLEEKRSMASSIKNPTGYRLVMTMLGAKDVSPYGLDVVRNRPFTPDKKERLRQSIMSL